jgi:hypothetical protein
MNQPQFVRQIELKDSQKSQQLGKDGIIVQQSNSGTLEKEILHPSHSIAEQTPIRMSINNHVRSKSDIGSQERNGSNTIGTSIEGSKMVEKELFTIPRRRSRSNSVQMNLTGQSIQIDSSKSVLTNQSERESDSFGVSREINKLSKTDLDSSKYTFKDLLPLMRRRKSTISISTQKIDLTNPRELEEPVFSGTELENPATLRSTSIPKYPMTVTNEPVHKENEFTDRTEYKGSSSHFYLEYNDIKEQKNTLDENTAVNNQVLVSEAFQETKTDQAEKPIGHNSNVKKTTVLLIKTDGSSEAHLLSPVSERDITANITESSDVANKNLNALLFAEKTEKNTVAPQISCLEVKSSIFTGSRLNLSLNEHGIDSSNDESNESVTFQLNSNWDTNKLEAKELPLVERSKSVRISENADSIFSFIENNDSIHCDESFNILPNEGRADNVTKRTVPKQDLPSLDSRPTFARKSATSVASILIRNSEKRTAEFTHTDNDSIREDIHIRSPTDDIASVTGIAPHSIMSSPENLDILSVRTMKSTMSAASHSVFVSDSNHDGISDDIFNSMMGHSLKTLLKDYDHTNDSFSMRSTKQSGPITTTDRQDSISIRAMKSISSKPERKSDSIKVVVIGDSEESEHLSYIGSLKPLSNDCSQDADSNSLFSTTGIKAKENRSNDVDQDQLSTTGVKSIISTPRNRSKSVGDRSTLTPEPIKSQSQSLIGIYSKEKLNKDIFQYSNEGIERRSKQSSKSSLRSQNSIQGSVEEEIEEPQEFSTSHTLLFALPTKPRSRSNSHPSLKASTFDIIEEQEEHEEQ